METLPNDLSADDGVEERSDSFTVILIYFGGRYWEGGNFSAGAATNVYASGKKNAAVYRAQLLRYDDFTGWKLLAHDTKPIPPIWYEQRGIERRENIDSV